MVDLGELTCLICGLPESDHDDQYGCPIVDPSISCGCPDCNCDMLTLNGGSCLDCMTGHHSDWNSGGSIW